MSVTVAALKLLQQLLRQTSRQSRTFDKYQQAFLKNLQKSNSDNESDALYNRCIEHLCEHVSPIENTLSEGRIAVSKSHAQLQKIATLSGTTKQKIAASCQLEQPYTVIEHHNELTELIKIYQRVVIELNQEHHENSIDDDPVLLDSICDELQQVILDIDVTDEYAKELEKIRKKVSSTQNPAILPQYCLQIIRVIIDSTREERRSSRHFLYTLNDNLTQFYLNFSKNLKCAEATFESQEKCVSEVKQQSAQLKVAAQQATDIEALQKKVADYVDYIDNVIEIRKDGQEVYVRQQFHGMVRQVRELQNETNSYQKTLKQQSKQLYIDFLTKIPNRVAWSERLNIEFTRFKRYQHNLNIAVIDIDHFKGINDSYGHLAGDKVLNVVAQTLQKSVRNTDFIARYGGEEFTLLLPDINLEQSHQVLKKLCAKIESIPFKFKKQDVSITISIGCTSFNNSDDTDSAFERADQALYKAKSNGRNQVICSDS